ncbi:MAG: hypothetical protein JRJ84_16930 [Deltaproteobacteria bacterium]|nr:hypothetical protein [Deltaproteobacteria bacterium]
MSRNTLGIRRETKSFFERRVPLTPEAVGMLIRSADARVLVERSDARVFLNEAYEAVGAELVDDASDADVVIGVKEIPTALFREFGTYLFFSHVIKGQAQNMGMLRRLVDLRCTLLDYEKITSDDGRRLIFFSWYAGVAGVVDTLYALGRRLEGQGVSNPFSALDRTWEYGELALVEEAFRDLGRSIRHDGLPEQLAPFVVGITGYGNTSRGAQHLLRMLPYQEITPDELPALRARTDVRRDRITLVVFKEEHTVVPRDEGVAFDLQDFFDHPERYRGAFERHAVHLDVLFNCIFWTEASPRLLTRDFLRQSFAGDEPPRLKAVGDISCDIEGAIECLTHVTTPDVPAFVYDPARDEAIDGNDGPGLLVMGVDFLPGELPKDASEDFSEVLLPMMPALLDTDFTLPPEALDLPGSMKRAIILLRGEFMPEYRYLERFLR